MPEPQKARRMIDQFFRPKWTKAYVLRLAIVTVVAFVTFKFILGPAYIYGGSMEPTYRDGSLMLYLRTRYAFSEPAVGDVVIIRYTGDRVMLLKRIVALEGDSISIVNGTLYRNGEAQEEPYIVNRNPHWMLEPRRVAPGNIYVIGDNRGMPMQEHRFGETERRRIAGAPLW